MKNKKHFWLVLPIAAVIIFVAFLILNNCAITGKQKLFSEKADLLKKAAVTEKTITEIGGAPAGAVGHVVFFSVSDGSARANVYKGTGKDLMTAWDNAVKNTLKKINYDTQEPKWVRVDIVSKSWITDEESIAEDLANVEKGFYFNGLSLDAKFETALLDGELNGYNIYAYNDKILSLNRMNRYLKDHGDKELLAWPSEMTGFDCWGWFCDEDRTVYTLYREDADDSRRIVSMLDKDYAKNIIDSASSYLVDQVKSDGTFIYFIYPQFDIEEDDYNILRHSGTIWSLICRYRMFPDDELKEKIDNAIGVMLDQLIYDGTGAAYMCEMDGSEIKLGGNGIAIVTMTEYMDLFQNEKYRNECIELGRGIIAQQGKDGSYWHILNTDLTKAEPFRTVYYDGECTFALTRLYSLTGDQTWLDAACKAIDYFIAEDYTQYRDHWVAYSLNEVTKYIDKREYYDFALLNATNNYERIEGRWRTYPTNLELLISVFETWQRMVDKGIDTGDFDVQKLLDVIDARANRQLSGYFYPETAMYMQNPQRILNTFMMRDSRFRVRIDDVQHNIGGYYLYWKNYDAMLKAGLDPSSMDVTDNLD